jgi:hypothetical protein
LSSALIVVAVAFGHVHGVLTVFVIGTVLVALVIYAFASISHDGR